MRFRGIRTFAWRALRAVLAGLTVASLGVAALVAWLGDDFTREMAEQRARIAQGSRVVPTACGPVEVAEAGPRAAQAVPAAQAGQASQASQATQATQGAQPAHAAKAANDSRAAEPAPGVAPGRVPLLVVHGSGGGFDQGLALGEDYAARGWQVIAPSRFGYLRTPWPADTPLPGQGPPADLGARQADQLACLLDALGVAEVAVLGVSAGAIAATEFAVRHPSRLRALVLLVPAGHRPETAPALPGWAQALLEATVSSDAPYWLASRFAPDTVRRFVLATPPEAYAAASPAERQRADRTMREVLPIGARRLGLLHDTLATQAVPRPRLEAIGVPTLALSARDDGFGTLASAAYSAQHIPGARLLVFEQGGHLLLGRQAEAVAAVEAFLSGAQPGGR